MKLAKLTALVVQSDEPLIAVYEILLSGFISIDAMNANDLLVLF